MAERFRRQTDLEPPLARDACSEKENRLLPNNRTPFSHKRCSLVGVNKSATPCTKEIIGERILRSLNILRLLVKYSMDVEETTSIIKNQAYATVDPSARGRNGCWDKQWQTLSVWLYAGRLQADGLQKDTQCPLSGTRAIPE